MPSIAEKSLAVCQLFEGELLLELMLRYWQHPLADDSQFRNEMIEAVTMVLQEAVAGSYFIEGISPAKMNFVAALYYAELRSCEDAATAGDENEVAAESAHCRPSFFALVLPRARSARRAISRPVRTCSLPRDAVHVRTKTRGADMEG